MFRLAWFAFRLWCCFVLVVGSSALPAAAQTTETPYDNTSCTQNGGDRDCIPLTQGDWRYGASPGYATEAEYVAVISQPNCSGCAENFSWTSDWGTSCQGASTTYWMGISILEYRSELQKGYGPNGEPVYSFDGCGSRQRTLSCPSGYSMVQPASGGGYCMGPPTIINDQTQKACDACDPSSNPIFPSIGNKQEFDTDYVGTGPFPLVFRRAYNSKLELGGAWVHTYTRFIKVSGNTYKTAKVLRPDGKTFSFYLNGGSWITDADINARLQSNGNGWTYWSAENDEVETYDANGRLVSITNRARLQQTLTYDESGHLIRVTDPFGRYLTLTSDTQGHPTSMTDPAGNLYLYGVDSIGRLANVTYPDGKIKTYLYENTSYPGALTGIVDENNSRYSTYTYNAQGLAVQSEHAGGVGRVTVNYGTPPQTVTTSSIDPNTGVQYKTISYVAPTGVTTTDVFGTVRSVNYQSVLGVVKRSGISANGCLYCSNTSASTFDANGNVASRTDLNGNQTVYSYDLARNLETSRTEAYGTTQARTITTQWHSTFRLPTQIDEPGRRTTFQYDNVGNLLQKTITDTATNASRTWTYTYNANGQVLTEDGPRTDVNDVTTYTYDNFGNVATITNALGHTTQFTSYDANGRPLTIIAPNGFLTKILTYDARGRLTSYKFNNTETTTYTYDAAGQIIKVTLPSGAYLTYTYDAAHRLTQINDQLNNKIVYTLDLMGNRIKEDIYDPANNLIKMHSRIFDSLNRLQQDIGANSNEITQYGYDNNGNVTSVTDPLNHTTYSGFDALNRLIQVIDANNGVTRYGYSGLDQLNSVTDPRNLSTNYAKNAFDGITQTTSPDSGITQAAFDSAGNMISRKDAKNQTTIYEYDALNRVTKETRADSTVVTYTYDNGATQKGLLTGMTDPSGSTTFFYGNTGRLIRQTQVIGSKILVTTYNYNNNGQVIRIIYPSGNVINYEWTTYGEIAAVKMGTAVIANNFIYQPFGPLKSWDLVTGETMARSFDLNGRMTGTNTNTLIYDAAGRIVNAYGYNYTYDNLDRLISYQDIGSSATYTYSLDANGNRIQQTSGGVVNNYAIDPNSNHIQSISAGTITMTYSHDANGSVTSDGTNSFTYDAAGRMVQASNGTTVVGTYAYNGAGQRVKKMVGSVATYFAYDVNRKLIGEYSDTGPLQETIYVDDTPIAVISNGQVFYMQSDHLNAPKRLRDVNSMPRWNWWVPSFGATTPNENPAGLGVFKYNLRFPGQYADAETGLYYNYYRDYDPKTGRYIESDPIGLRGGLNTYSYVNGNPLNGVDPLGLRDVDVHIWRAEGSSVGHVMVTEANSTQVILSQFPSNGYPLGPNETKSFADTMAAEGRPASEIWRINVPNDNAFDAAAARERSLKLWSWSPSNDSTQCSVAASRALKAGGVGLHTITTGTLMPGFFANGLKATPGIGTRLP